MRNVFGPVLLGMILAITAPVVADEPRLSDDYGFLPPEIYKLDSRIQGLVLRDLDGDGTADILVVNNARSRIDLLLSKPAPAGACRALLQRDEPHPQ